ncbi:NADH:flavin oxidoreductase/NADH oxidase family protein [Microbulbifer yueqingensis]|uniref:2,4-dienoyl-CoA reductase n=1 Tax=Microbulbifer yueqingensis TaxID=658219 RepID=A0A1G8Z8W1_9GAMM|nr:NADH:flavin oxidoreductase/NADH oxidase family protein [Microbulbifer yueqingensis]SDK11074.1 2,4-dienoyl-CoA reductase [Microbulbifer yueqingensis]
MLATPVTLPNGLLLPNRFAKSAMEEELGRLGAPTDAHINLYHNWSSGNPGLLVTGNVMVDRRAMTDPGAVFLEDESNLQQFRAWASAGRQGGNLFLMQINHPGRQIPKYLCERPLAPSAVGVEVPGGRGLFNTPRPMSDEEIREQVRRFARTASLAVEAGFDGVQVHAAHGYLISQFLSPLTNRREDRWGGSPDNRARFLFEVLAAVRAVLPRGKALSVKLNSADFQSGGFAEEDALQVIARLAEFRVDLLEISGGNYESPAMMDGRGATSGRHTAQREGFFLEFAEKARAVAPMPLMVTGGFRTRRGMEEALKFGAVDVIGMAKPFCLEPLLPRKMLNGELTEVHYPTRRLRTQAMSSLGVMASARTHIRRIARNRRPDPGLNVVLNLVRDFLSTQLHAWRYRRWLRKNPGPAAP